MGVLNITCYCPFPSFSWATKSGNKTPEGPCKLNVALEDSGVFSGLTSTTGIPFSRAISASPAAGHTKLEVPTEKNTSHVNKADSDSRRASEGMD